MKMHLKLAKKNREVDESSWQRLRAHEIVRRIRKTRSKSEELALLRKAVACLFEVVEGLHKGEIKNEEFIAYHKSVERIKAEVDADMKEDV